MLIVKIEGKETLERALKKLKNKFQKIGIVKELRERTEFKKPSVKRREVLKKAKYVEKMRRESED